MPPLDCNTKDPVQNATVGRRSVGQGRRVKGKKGEVEKQSERKEKKNTLWKNFLSSSQTAPTMSSALASRSMGGAALKVSERLSPRSGLALSERRATGKSKDILE